MTSIPEPATMEICAVTCRYCPNNNCSEFVHIFINVDEEKVIGIRIVHNTTGTIDNVDSVRLAVAEGTGHVDKAGNFEEQIVDKIVSVGDATNMTLLRTIVFSKLIGKDRYLAMWMHAPATLFCPPENTIGVSTAAEHIKLAGATQI